METYNAILDFLLAAVAVGVIGATVYMVITYGLSGAWAKRIDLRNLISGPLIFGMMLLGLRYAPAATMQSTTFGINRAADDTPALKQALGRLLDEVREPAERALNVDATDINTGGGIPTTGPYSIIITSTPTPWQPPAGGLDAAGTATAYFAQFPTAVPPEYTPGAPPTNTPIPTHTPASTAAPDDPDFWSHDRPPTPVPGGRP